MGMDTINAIRACIFLVAGALLILFPKNILKFQKRVVMYLERKLNVNKKILVGTSEKSNVIIGIAFLIISTLLFIYSVLN